MATEEPIVAVGLLTATELDRLGKTFTRFCPLDDTAAFDDLLRKIDIADAAWRDSKPPPSMLNRDREP